MPLWRDAPRLSLLGIVAIAATVVSVAAGGGGVDDGPARVAPSAWRGLVGAPRPQVTVGQRMVVVLRAPSLAERVARVGGRASEDQERRWTTTALAAQRQLLGKLAAKGLRIEPDFTFTRVLSGFSAPLDPRAVALLERSPEVQGVYPVRVAYPAAETPLREAGVALAYRPGLGLPGFDGRGVTIALVDTGVDLEHRYLRGRVDQGIDVLDDDGSADAEPSPEDGELERHGTQLAGVVAGLGGPGGLRGVASAASLLPIRAAGWQRDALGRWAVYARTDQLVAGLERAVDPNGDGDAHDAARIALVGLAEPYAAFDDSPSARAVEGALLLDTLVVAPAGNDGPAGPRFGSISGPAGAEAALAVGAVDLRPRVRHVRVALRAGLEVALDRLVPLAGAVEPDRPITLPVEPIEPAAGELGESLSTPGAQLSDFFDERGFSRVAGRAALVPAGDAPAAVATSAARAGAVAVVLHGGGLPAGGIGLDEEVPVPVVSISSKAAREVAGAVARGARAAVTIGEPVASGNGLAGRVALFSSRGLAFDARVKPDLVAPGVGVLTSEPGRARDGSARFGSISGSSAAAGVVAGTAALLAQARPELDAPALKSLLVGSARPLASDPVAAEGAGLVDIGAAAAAEAAALPSTLAFRTPAGPGWRETASLLVRNLSTRTLRVEVDPGERGAVVLAAAPRLLTLPPGQTRRVFVTARLAYGTLAAKPVEGAILLRSSGGAPLRVPWLLTFKGERPPLLSAVQLSEASYKPSDTAPAVLSLQAGRLLTRAGSQEVYPVSRLEIVLATASGRRIGVLARVRDLLPGRYSFGLTGRGPDGTVLARGRYRLLLRATPTAGGAPSTASVRFRIE